MRRAGCWFFLESIGSSCLTISFVSSYCVRLAAVVLVLGYCTRTVYVDWLKSRSLVVLCKIRTDGGRGIDDAQSLMAVQDPRLERVLVDDQRDELGPDFTSLARTSLDSVSSVFFLSFLPQLDGGEARRQPFPSVRPSVRPSGSWLLLLLRCVRASFVRASADRPSAATPFSAAIVRSRSSSAIIRSLPNVHQQYLFRRITLTCFSAQKSP